MSPIALISSFLLSALVVGFAGAALLCGDCTFPQFVAVAAPFAGGTAIAHVTRSPSV